MRAPIISGLFVQPPAAVLPDANLVFRLDMGSSTTYNGSGSSFGNIETTPADGESQSTYNFTSYNGVGNPGTEDTTPLFRGTPGTGETTNYFETDSGGRERLRVADTTFLQTLHKNNAEFSLMVCFASVSTASTNVIFTTGHDGNRTNLGFHLCHTGIAAIGNGSTEQQLYSAGMTEDDTVPKIIVISVDEAANQGYWMDTDTQSSTPASFSTTYSSPSASNTASGTILCGEVGGGGAHDAYLYSAYLWNVALTESEVLSAFNFEKSLRGI